MFFEVELFKVYLLVLVRVSGLIVTAPVLGSRNFPATAKVGLAAFTALVITTSLPAQGGPLPDGALAFGVLSMGELAIGLMMGFVMQMVFAAVQVAGQVIDMLSGFAMMNVFNPALETQVPIFGFFLYIMAALYLLAWNGHHLMIRGLVATFDKIPLGGFAMEPALFWQASVWGRAMFLDGLTIAAPVAASLLVAYVTMGLLGRVVPQIQLFVVGFPVTIALGLLTVAFIMGVYVNILDGMFEQMFRNVEAVVQGMT
jgi:flagellar biosynthesis protein FliR